MWNPYFPACFGKLPQEFPRLSYTVSLVKLLFTYYEETQIISAFYTSGKRWCRLLLCFLLTLHLVTHVPPLVGNCQVQEQALKFKNKHVHEKLLQTFLSKNTAVRLFSGLFFLTETVFWSKCTWQGKGVTRFTVSQLRILPPFFPNSIYL